MPKALSASIRIRMHTCHKMPHLTSYTKIYHLKSVFVPFNLLYFENQSSLESWLLLLIKDDNYLPLRISQPKKKRRSDKRLIITSFLSCVGLFYAYINFINTITNQQNKTQLLKIIRNETDQLHYLIILFTSEY